MSERRDMQTQDYGGTIDVRETNREFIYVLDKVVRALRTAMHDQRLPDLSAQEVVDWFRSVQPSHVQHVLDGLDE